MATTAPATTPPPAADPSTTLWVKPGWATSEHALSVAAVILSALFAANVFPTDSPITKVAIIAGIVLTQLGYTVSRTVTKAVALKAHTNWAIAKLAARSAPVVQLSA